MANAIMDQGDPLWISDQYYNECEFYKTHR
jgi:hypothetical protein